VSLCLRFYIIYALMNMRVSRNGVGDEAILSIPIYKEILAHTAPLEHVAIRIQVMYFLTQLLTYGKCCTHHRLAPTLQL